jgi:hypothetical protein
MRVESQDMLWHEVMSSQNPNNWRSLQQVNKKNHKLISQLFTDI